MTDHRLNYALRPAKAIERKMMCEAFQKLRALGPVERYRYVGFGAMHFVDFGLFHRALGISDMISIERETGNAARFRFNRPFKCIKIVFGEATDVIPYLRWTKPTIVWLDYEQGLDSTVLGDVENVCLRAKPGSVLVVTVNAEPLRKPGLDLDELFATRLEFLRQTIGPERTPIGLQFKDLTSWGLASTFRTVIANQITETLTDRGAALAANQQLVYKQMFHFHYSDGARMLTTGGIILRRGQLDAYEGSGITELQFVREGAEACPIDAPTLTYKELKHLNAQLPAKSPNRVKACGIAQEDLEKYAAVYRYFPTYAETEL